MKKATNKLMSFLAAFAMVLSVLVAPFTSANAAGETQEKETEKLTIHKILMSQDALDKHNVEKEGYDGNKIKDIKDFFESGAEEIAGVYFKLQKPADGKTNPDVNTDADWVDMGQDYEGLTTANGLELNTKGLSGSYRIVEVHEKSTYVGKDGATLTDKKAVPSIVVLPLVNNDGVVTDAHMYPKNTENAPKIDKNFLKENGLEAAEGYEAKELLKVGADYNNYKAKKSTAEAEIGKNIPYEVKTEIPAKSNLAEAKWDDKMTAGLTYNKDLTVTIDYVEVEGEGEDAKEVQKSSTLTTEELTKSGELTQSDKGFVLKLQGDNLALLNGKVKPVTVTLKYSATVNSSAIADIPEANDIKFFYGNTPSNGTTPLPTKPNENGEVTVEKTWGGKDSDWVEGEYAKFKLVDANTGEDVTAADLVNAPEDYTFESVVELKKDGNKSYTWKYLNKDKQYKAVEVESKTLSDAEYTKAENGKIEVTNHKSNNPKPLNPTEPKVVLGGKKFVKTNQDGKERLAGAEFYVKNEKGEYLVAAKKDAQAVTDAKAALDKAVKTYNDRVQGEEETDEAFEAREKELKAAIDSAQETYNKAFKENATAYTWGEKTDANVVVLTSDGQGRFEITGLEYGSYKLEEKTAPKGYAKRSGDVDFKVEKGSYSTKDVNIKYNAEDAENSAKQVTNKKVTIPQTGGIGSLIFIVAGLALMGVAFVAMKRRNSYEEA
ncbi:pilin N-terminal domain-containing protein [Anaerococcus sp. ENR0831]|uniref:Pilin N-terminal domain-containing protein n=1 Tax=Anaerococcus martiniensis TaxID=3115615 RepID=A0ABW9M9P8_9FIRM